MIDRLLWAKGIICIFDSQCCRNWRRDLCNTRIQKLLRYGYRNMCWLLTLFIWYYSIMCQTPHALSHFRCRVYFRSRFCSVVGNFLDINHKMSMIHGEHLHLERFFSSTHFLFQCSRHQFSKFLSSFSLLRLSVIGCRNEKYGCRVLFSSSFHSFLLLNCRTV